MPTDPSGTWRRTALTTARALRRAAAAFGLAMAGLLAAPLALAHDTPQPIANTEGGSGVVAVSAGWYHSCGLKADGAVDCWGWNDYGQAADQPGPYLSVVAGYRHTCGLKADGAVDCWGDNAYGQAVDQPGPYLSVSAGYWHTCGLKADGAVDCWGWNGDGQAADQPGPYLSVSAGFRHSCGLKADGAVDCWGNNDNGQAVDQPGPYLSVSAGVYHSCGLKADGAVDCWGWNDDGQAADQPGPYLSVVAGYVHSCGLKADGAVDCWGDNGDGKAADQPGPYLSVSAGLYHSCGLKADGAVDCWGNNGDGQATVPAEMSAAGSAGFGQIAAGNNQTCQLKRDGRLSCWGANNENQATPPAGLFTQMAAGNGLGCAIGTNGKVTCWGRPSANFLTFSFGFSDSYRQLAMGPQYVACAVGRQSWCVNETNGVGSVISVRNITGDYSSGSNTYCGVAPEGTGRCSDVGGTPTARNAAIPAGLWQRLESGLDHQCGLRPDGSIDCWGASGADQMVNLPAATEKFRAFSVGWNHACAIKGDGTLSCWGSNINGQATPPSGTFVQVAAGNTFTCGIRDNGTRTCWGSDAQGQAPQLMLSPGSIADGLVGSAHAGASFALADAGQNADGDYVPPSPVFYADPADLPPGLSLSATGVLSGTPTTGGSYTFTVEGEDGNGFAASREYTLTIVADSTPPVISYTLNGHAAPPATPDGDNGWYVSNVAVAWTVVDAESGIASSTGCSGSTLTGDATGASATCSATNGVGLDTEVTTVPVNIDITKPTIGVNATPAANGTGWNNGDVTVSYTCTDATSGIASCPATQTLSTEGIGISTTIPISTDNAGNDSDPGTVVSVNIDKTAPTISAAATTAPNGNNGWYISDVSVAFTCGDALSGVVSCPAAQTLSSEGNAISSTAQTISDQAGNGATSNVVTVQIDKTPPTITAAATTAPNANGWYSGDVTIHFTCSDATSGVVACPADQVLTTSGSSSTPTIQDNAGNSATSNAVTVQIDKSAPLVGYVFAPPAPDGNNGWYRSNVGIDWTIGDAQSGIASSNGCADSTLSSDTSGANWTCTATNNAGLQASATTGTIKRDATPPTLSPTVPSPLLRGQSYSASPNASDATSGIASQSCGALDTSTTGSKSTTCSATDNAGNSRTATLNYTVSTTCSNDGYSGTQLTWCRNICEMGYTGATLDIWIHRWINRYRDLPYCLVAPQPVLQ